MAASVTNGNMFIVSNRQNAEFTLNDLKGHVLYSIGQGSVPAFIMLKTLTNAGIECVDDIWTSYGDSIDIAFLTLALPLTILSKSKSCSLMLKYTL